MSKKDHISIDELFSQKLMGAESDTQSSDWEAMSRLLDADDEGLIVPLAPLPTNRTRHFTLKTIIIMSILFTTVSAIVVSLWPQTSAVPTSGTTATKQEIASAIIEPNEHKTSTLQETVSLNSNLVKRKLAKSDESSGSGSAILESSDNANRIEKKIMEEILPSISEEPKDSIKNVVARKIKKQLIQEVWVDPEYDYELIGHDKEFMDAWLGIHFTQENSFTPRSAGTTSGFNFQIMSGDVFKQSPLALYGGLDWGMQFRGRTAKTDVILSNDDPAYTLMTSLNHDLLLRGHIEYPKYRVVPYLTGFVGPRMYFTGQKVSMYSTPANAEGESRENVDFSATWVAGVGTGARVKLSPYISFDARYEWMYGAVQSLVDLKNSNFGTTNYDLAYAKEQTNLGQVKVGLIFDISHSDYDKKIIKEGYYKQETVTYYLDPKDIDKIIIVPSCTPCDCDSQKVESVKNENESPLDFILDMLNTIDSSGGSGGGTSPMPDIKAPVIRNK